MQNTSKCAPIVVFVYNRLDHTQKTISSLAKNKYARDSDLFIYSDGAKNSSHADSVRAVREYIHSVTGFNKITIIERENNWGLANNIMDGVTSIVNQYGKIIVLEDDIVTSEFFLEYMNTALERYAGKPEVMEISGFSYPIAKQGLPEAMFLHYADCWGWATWKRSWDKFERNPENLVKEFTSEDIYHFNFEGTNSSWRQVEKNLTGELYTWAIFWQAAIFKSKGYMLYPRDSLVYNCGFDGTGDHKASEDKFNSLLSDRPITDYPDVVSENELARKRLRKYFKSQKPSLPRIVVQKILKLIKPKSH